MKLNIAAALCSAAASAAFADGTPFNVVRAAIEAEAAVEYAGGKRAGYSYSETFPVSALFDGVTSSTSAPTNGWFGGILSGGYAEVKLPEAYMAGLASVPETTKYVVHRFDYGNAYAFDASTKYPTGQYAMGNNFSDVRHAPTAWTLEATTNGRDWTTVDEQTGVKWGEAEYSKTFTLATAGKFVGFRFVPTNSWRFENRSGTVLPPEHPFDVGLMEIEYLAEIAPSASGVLFVTSDYPDENDVQVVTASGTVSAPSCGYDGGRRFGAVTGYTLATWTDGAWVDDGTVSAQSYEFAADGTAKRLTWHFDEEDVTGYRLDAQVVAPGYESFEYSSTSSPDAAGYYAPGTTVTVTPVEHAEPPYSYFYRWEGDGVTAENAKTKVLTLTMDGAKTVRCWFDRAWKLIDATTEVTPLGYFSGRWAAVQCFAIFDGCNAITYLQKVSDAAIVLNEKAYGGLATQISEGGRINFTTDVYMSDSNANAKFAKMSSLSATMKAAEAVYGENITAMWSMAGWPNLVHVEGVRETKSGNAPSFNNSPVTNNVTDLIPAMATSIPPNAFNGTKVCGELVELPYATKIGGSAFAGTPIVEVVATNAALNNLRNGAGTPVGNAFKGMSNLKTVTLCATNLTGKTDADRITGDFRFPKIQNLRFISGYPPMIAIGALGSEWSNSFDTSHDTYIYASKKQAGWKEHVLPVSEFTEEELALRASDPKLGSRCFGIVTNYSGSVVQKLGWAVHRASPDDKQTGFVMMVR